MNTADCSWGVLDMTLLNRWFDFLDLLRMDRWFNKLEMTFFCGAVVLFLHPMDEPFKPFAYFTVWNLFFLFLPLSDQLGV